MKNVLAVLILITAFQATSAQVVVHDYLWINTLGASIYIASTVDDERVIVPPKDERKGITGMQKAYIMLIQEYEADGSELFDFDTYQRETEMAARSTWIMRRPRQ